MDFINFIDSSNLFSQPNTVPKRRCFFDLEGSLDAYQGCILQLACVITDWDYNILDVEMRYFNTDKPINEKEQSVHKLTKELLNSMTDKLFHEVYKDTLLNSEDTMFISYTTFDVRRINQELLIRGEAPLNFGKEVSSLKYQGGSGNVHFDAFSLTKTKLAQYINTIPNEEMTELWNLAQGFMKDMKCTFNAHDALYDTLATYHLCRKLGNA